MPVTTALLFFPFLAALAVLPYAIIQYRKYGSISKLKLVVFFSFSFYLLCAYFLVILPLPDKDAVRQLTTARYNLQPFNVVRYFFSVTALRPLEPATYLPALKQSAFLQPFFNLMLTVPFGLYLRYIWKISFKKVILASFCLSLFFELTQLSGLYFIYPRSYRLFDVDDLLLNTVGGMLGYWIEPLFSKLFPSMTELNAQAEKEHSIASFWRRLAAWMIDSLIFSGIFTLLGLLSANITEDSYLLYLLGCFVYFVLLPYCWHGATLGKRIVKIRIVDLEGKKVGFFQLILRQFLLFGVGTANFRFLLPAITRWIEREQGKHLELQLTVWALAGMFGAIFVLNALILLFKKNSRMYYERAAKTKEIGY